MTAKENRDSLCTVKRSLITAHSKIAKVADFMETWLTTEYEMLSSKEYGLICRTLGVLEEQIAEISNLSRSRAIKIDNN